MTRHKTSSRLLAMLLSLILVIGMLPTTVFASDDPITYLDEDGISNTLEEGYTNVTTSDTSWTTGWYVVDGTVTVDSRV